MTVNIKKRKKTNTKKFEEKKNKIYILNLHLIQT